MLSYFHEVSMIDFNYSFGKTFTDEKRYQILIWDIRFELI